MVTNKITIGRIKITTLNRSKQSMDFEMGLLRIWADTATMNKAAQPPPPIWKSPLDGSRPKEPHS